jgi:hypothetical protein
LRHSKKKKNASKWLGGGGLIDYIALDSGCAESSSQLFTMKIIGAKKKINDGLASRKKF